MCGVTKKDKIRNEHARGSVKVELVTNKITQKRLKWYGRRARTKGLCKVKKIQKKSKTSWKWVGGSRSHLDKKN